MDEVWLSAPLAAMRICIDGGGVRWQSNPAARQSAWGRALRDSQWQELAHRLMAECTERPGGAEGLVSTGDPAVELAWTAVALDEGWLVWLVEQPSPDAQLPRASDTDLPDRLALLQDFGRMGLFERNIRTGVGRWDPQVFQLYGFDASDGTPDYEQATQSIHPDDRERVRETHRDVVQRAGRYEVRFRIVSRDGRVSHVHSMSEVRNGADGKPEHMIGVLIDDTANVERASVQQAELEAVRERARNATEAAGIGLWERDLRGGASFWNAQMYRLRGLDPEDPRPVEQLAALANHPEDQAALDELARRHIEDGVPYEHEMRVTWPDGSVHWLGTRGNVVRDAEGRPLRLSGVNWDITQHKLVEQALRDKQAAEQASRAKSEFLARMSHELRTPLNAVLGFAQLMVSDQQDPLTKQQRDRLSQMQTAGRHLLDLINDVLDLAGVEPAAPAPAARRVSLSDAVRESMQWVAALAEERQVKLGAEKISGTVLADRRRMRQILTNLLSNAVKYNRPGGSVDISSVQREHDGQQQCGIIVRDTGIGMTAAQVGQLFQPFNRLGAEFSTVEGTGIGLTIVRQIVHRMGGHVGVDSKPRMGSSFTVWLPAAPDETSPAAFDPSAPMSLSGSDAAADTERETKLRVLCIEDNPVNLLLVKELFSLRPAVELITAANGAEGIAAARHRRPHLVLLDMQLPDMHGLDVLKRLRDEPLLDKTRFVALSANAMAQDVAQALGAGFEDYWTKPIDFGKFLAGIDAIAASRH
jgi:PAS domain S-box-containing protein